MTKIFVIRKNAHLWSWECSILNYLNSILDIWKYIKFKKNILKYYTCWYYILIFNLHFIYLLQLAYIPLDKRKLFKINKKEIKILCKGKNVVNIKHNTKKILRISTCKKFNICISNIYFIIKVSMIFLRITFILEINFIT